MIANKKLSNICTHLNITNNNFWHWWMKIMINLFLRKKISVPNALFQDQPISKFDISTEKYHLNNLLDYTNDIVYIFHILITHIFAIVALSSNDGIIVIKKHNTKIHRLFHAQKNIETCAFLRKVIYRL